MTDSVNRHIADPDMRRIHHALGCPLDPMEESYRNHFATESDSDTATAFRQSENWAEYRRSGDLSYFRVTNRGRKELAEYLAATKDPWRSYNVFWDGYVFCQAERTRGKAIYAVWLRVSECYEISFGQFIRQASARLAK